MKDHRIVHYDADEHDRVHWECSCGAGGSAPEWDWDLHSDKHINYDLGEGRTDVYPPR